MSNKPKIHAFCAAGCKWETVHYDDFQKSAPFVSVPLNENGSASVNPFERYRIKSPIVSQSIETLEAILAAIPTPYMYKPVLVGTKLYFFIDDTNKSVYTLDIETQKIELLSATQPYAVHRALYAVAVGTSIYLFYQNNNSVRVGQFDTETNVFTTVKNYDEMVLNGSFAPVVVGSYIYFIGTNNTVVYDTYTGTHGTLGATVPTGTSASAVAVERKIYAFGGSGNTNIYILNTANNEIITSEATWTADNNSPAIAESEGNVYLFNNEKISSYNILTDTITELEAIEGYSRPQYAYAVNSQIYFTGGTYLEVYRYPDYQSAVRLKYTDNGEEKESSLLLGQLDKYRDYYDIEILGFEAPTIYGNKEYVNVVYETSNIRTMFPIEGTSLDMSNAELLITGATKILIYNADATIVAEAGKDGHNPEKGVDYLTDEDMAEIKSYVDEAILGGAW